MPLGYYIRMPNATPLILVAVGVVLAAVVLPVAWRVVARYLLVPLGRRRDTYPMQPRYVPLDLTRLPEDVASQFHRTCAQLASHRFTASGHFQTHRDGTRVQTWGYVSVWAGPDGGTTAQVVGVIADAAGGARRCQTSVVLRSDFPDGRDIATSNLKSVGVFPPDPKRDAVVWPAMQDFAVLWRLHAARLARVAYAPLPPPGRDRAAEYLAEHQRGLMRRQVAHGYLRADPANQVYRCTMKGTFLMVWRILWPWRNITTRRHARRLKATLRELEMAGIAGDVR